MDENLFGTDPRPAPKSRQTRRRAPGHGLHSLIELAVTCSGVGSESYEKYQILRAALGVKTDVLARDGGSEARQLRIEVIEDGRRRWESRAGAPLLAARAVAQARELEGRRVASLFRNYLEAPPDFQPLYEAHDAELVSAADQVMRAQRQMIRALTRLAVDAITSAEPDTADRRVTDDELRALGWPEPRPPAPRSDFGDDDW